MEGKELKRLSEMNPTINQPNTTEEAQMSSDEVVVNEESYPKKSKAKWRRWKNQARTSNKMRSNQVEPSNVKRTSCDTRMTNPKNKRPRLESLTEGTSTRAPENSPSAKIKLSGDSAAMEMMEMMEVTVKEISAEAGYQPRGKQ